MKHSISYKWLFILYYPLTALSVVHIGNDRTLQELLHMPSYYSDLALALGLSYGIGLYLHALLAKHKFHMNCDLNKRLRVQIYLGIIVPITVVTTAEMFYLYIIDINLAQSSMFYLEVPISLLFVSIINLFYFIDYTEYQLHLKITALQEGKAQNKKLKTNFVVNYGIQNLVITSENIAFIERHDKCTYLFTNSSQRFVLNEGLQSLSSQLDPEHFYQLNRQIIVHRQSILSYETTPTRKLKINLNPPPIDIQYVSKEKSGGFVKWLQHSPLLSASDLNMPVSHT
ncbi:MAG TPA: LytTR family DNA-binding domain-containing protein [Cytophagales bacterium]|nr:LytTR family DNA-binding domain-containing protein [Cytophagales bacterium]